MKVQSNRLWYWELGIPWVLLCPLWLTWKDERDKSDGLSSLPNDMIIWTEMRYLSPPAWSYWLVVWTGFEPATTCSADRLSPNWTNQVAVNYAVSQLLHAVGSCTPDGGPDLCGLRMIHVLLAMLACRFSDYIIIIISLRACGHIRLGFSD